MYDRTQDLRFGYFWNMYQYNQAVRPMVKNTLPDKPIDILLPTTYIQSNKSFTNEVDDLLQSFLVEQHEETIIQDQDIIYCKKI